MNYVYVLDACALLAVIKDEPHTDLIDLARFYNVTADYILGLKDKKN